MRQGLYSLCARLALAVLPLLALAASPAASDDLAPQSAGAERLRIAIHCSRGLLQVWLGPTLIREYPVETGKGGIHKRRSGDHRTPIGEYEIAWMASRHSPKGHRIVDGRSWCRDNKFSDAATGPPLEKLWSASYGADEASIMSLNYPNQKDRARGFTGDCIHIHSDKHLVDAALTKSFGCIHMFPQDARELYDMVNVGTSVKIFP
ncbi:MAG: L,D-transpeptidase family protein [Desulfomonilaceae bacterium]